MCGGAGRKSGREKPPSEREANRLLQQAQAGDESALGELLEQYRSYLLLISARELGEDLRRKVGDSDIVQQTFLEAQRDFPQFQGRTSAELMGWLRAMLRHNITDATRRFRNTQKRGVDQELWPDGEGSSEDVLGQLPADISTPSSLARRRERDEALERALQRLPENYRAVVLLRHRENLTFEEIGSRLDVSGEAARKLWARAVQRLQRGLEPSDES